MQRATGLRCNIFFIHFPGTSDSSSPKSTEKSYIKFQTRVLQCSLYLETEKMGSHIAGGFKDHLT